jgi:hypothetical protein
MIMMSQEVVLQTLKCSLNHYPRMLDEKFPHVLENVVRLWDTPDVVPYLIDLLQPDGRGGGRFNRDGFPEQAWQEILHLQILHGKQNSQ